MAVARRLQFHLSFTRLEQLPCTTSLKLVDEDWRMYMLNASVPNKPETQLFRGWLIVVYVVVISMAIDGALLLSAASERSWIGSAVTVISVALISVGALFTALEMPKLGRSPRP